MPKFIDEIDVVQSNTLSKQNSPITKPTSATENLMIINTLAAGANHPANKATRYLEGAVLTITNPHLSVDNTLYPDSEFTKPTTYEKKIQKVVNGTNVVMPPYKITRKSDGQTRAVPLNNFTFSITYEKTIVKPNTSGVFKKSYADIQFSNLQTFSGDVYKAKVFTKEKGSQGDFEKIGEVVLDGQNQLVNTNGVTGFETIGIFHTQSIIEDGWVTSSALASATQGEDDIAASVLLSGSNGANTSDFTFLTSGSYGLQRGEDYMVSFDTYFTKANKTDKDGNVSETAELEVYLTGSINSPTASEVSLGTLDNTFEGMKGRSEGRIDGVFNYFKTHNKAVVLPETKLGFRVKSGNFKLANVSLTPYFEKNFNPVSFRTLLPMPKPVKRGQRFDFYTEFYDFNNNKANFQAETSASVVFDGAPQILADGTDAVLTGSVFLGSTEGQGIELHGGSAYMRSLGYDGFDDTISNNVGGFLIFSGSVSRSLGTTEDYEGVGLEIVDAHGSTDRFLKFRTNPSEFTVQTDQFFFGKEGQFISGSNGNIIISSSNFFLGDDNGAFVSGSNGNINISSSNFFLGGGATFVSGSNGNLEISSSNFHLDDDGSVTMAGEISAEAGGTIGGWDIGTNTISDVNAQGKGIIIKSDASSPSIAVTASGANSIEMFHTTDTDFGIIGKSGGNTIFQLGSTNQIGGFGITNTAISSSNNNLILRNSGQITGSNVLLDGGTIGGFVITDSKIESSDFVSGLKGVRISTEQNGMIEAENARIRGTLATTTFEKETVNAVGGQLHVANATMITGSAMGLSDTSASVANVSGFTTGEVIIAKKVSGTGFNTEYMRVHSSSRLSSDENDQTGLLFVTRSFSNTTIAATGSEGFRGEAFGNSGSYEPGQVLVSTGVSGSGYIRLNANPKDLATPYIDIIERTGSGIYDTALKARLGDLSGLSRNVVGTSTPGFGLFSENVFLTGTISASAGAIGGISMDSGSLFVGTGTHGNANTAFFMDSGGKFSLKDKLVWDGTNLNIDGTLSIGSLPDGTVSGSAQLAADISGAADVSEVSASAAAGQSGSIAFDTHATQVVLSSAGMDVKNSSTQTIASFGASAKLFGGPNNTADFAEVNGDGLTIVANSETASIMNAGGTTIMGGNSTASISATGLALIQGDRTGSLFTATTSSVFGSDDKHERVEVVGTGMNVYQNNAQVANFGATTTIGSTSTEHIKISGSGFELKDGSTQYIGMDANGMSIGNNIILATNGNATFNGTVTIGGTDLTTGNTLNTNTDLGDVGLSLADISGSISGSYLNAGSSSMASRVKIESTGISVDNASGTSLASLTNSLRIGVVGDDKSRLEIDSSGNLEIINRQGSTDSTVISLDNAGNGIFAGGVNAVHVAATSGSIGGWTLASSTLTGGSVTLNSAGTVNATGTTAGFGGKSTTAQLSGSTSDGSSLTIKRDNIDGSAEIDIIKVNTEQVYGDPTAYTTNKDKAAITMGTGGNSVAEITVGGTGATSGVSAWGGRRLFLRANNSSDVTEVEVASSMAANEMLDSGEASNVVELSFDNLLVFFDDLDASGDKAQFQYKVELFQSDTNASASAELVAAHRFSDVLTEPVESGLNIPNAIINKRYFYLQLSGTGYDQITADHGDGNQFHLKYSSTPISGVRYLPKVNVTGLGFQTFAGPNQEVSFGADNKIIGDLFVRSTSVGTRGNIFVQGGMAIGGLELDADNELFVNGDIAATGNITAYFTSDKRLKNNVVRIEDGLSIINQLRPVEFEWDEKSPFSHLNYRDYGLIAQEVEKVLPNIVGEMKDGYKGVKYEKLIPFLIDSIQQLTKRVEELEDK